MHVATFREGDSQPAYRDTVDGSKDKVCNSKTVDPISAYSATYRFLWSFTDAKVPKLFLYSRKQRQQRKSVCPNIALNNQLASMKGEVEKSSIDEAFIDLTRPVRELILERYPFLGEHKGDLDEPLPSPPQTSKWTHESTIVNSSVASETDNQGHLLTWHDVALHLAAELLATTRAVILARLGYTTSAGIAKNKFLAKVSPFGHQIRKYVN